MNEKLEANPADAALGGKESSKKESPRMSYAIWNVPRQLLELLCSCPVTLTVVALTLIVTWATSLASILELHLHEQFGLLQILGCHLLHWSGEHLLWDLGMFTVIGIAGERAFRGRFALAFLACTLLIPLSVMYFNPAIESYRGLSGIDTGLFALVVASALLRGVVEQDRCSASVFGALYVLLWCKIGYEFYSGQVLFVQQVDFVPLPIAHAVGALVGTAFAFAEREALDCVGSLFSQAGEHRVMTSER